MKDSHREGILNLLKISLHEIMYRVNKSEFKRVPFSIFYNNHWLTFHYVKRTKTFIIDYNAIVFDLSEVKELPTYLTGRLKGEIDTKHTDK